MTDADYGYANGLAFDASSAESVLLVVAMHMLDYSSCFRASRYRSRE